MGHILITFYFQNYLGYREKLGVGKTLEILSTNEANTLPGK